MNTIESYWKERADELGFSVDELKMLCNRSMLVWAETHRKIMGKHFSLREYPFLEEIYMSDARELCILKSAQAGLSEFGVNLLFWVCDTGRGHGYLVFPTAKDVTTFVQGRIDSAKDETPYLHEKLKGKTDNTSIKRFGNRNMYFTGSQKRTQIISSPADCIVQDEYDEHNPYVDFTVQKRANNSKLRMFRRLSTPTVPNHGIHREYNRSSMARWVHKCKSCGSDVIVSGEDIADRWRSLVKEVDGGYEYCCPECHGTCDFTVGQWKHRYPKNEYKGYAINRMMTKTCTADDLMKSYTDAIESDGYSEFLRSDLGVPYEEPGSRIYEKDCMACEDNFGIIKSGVPSRDYFVGIDTGKQLHVTIGHESETGSPVIDFAETLNSYEEIDRIFQSFNVAMAVVDNRPEPTPVFDLYKKFHCVRGAEHNTGIVKPTSAHGKEDHIIGWNRFFSIERIYSYIAQRMIVFPNDVNVATERWFYKHMCSQAKIKIVSDTTHQESFDFRPPNGKKAPDHYLFSTIFMLAARDVYKEIKNNNLPSGFLIL